MTGKQWERHIAQENQRLYVAHRAMVARIPTHYHGGIPSRDPKVDFVGLVMGGQMVAIEAKAGSGSLKVSQRAYLQTVSELGGIAIVYRYIDGERHICRVDGTGEMQRKSSRTLCEDDTWLDWIERTTQ